MLERWATVEADFQLHYGIDLTHPRVCNRKSWRWFVTRLMGLPDRSRTWRGLQDHYRADVDESLDGADADLGVQRPT